MFIFSSSLLCFAFILFSFFYFYFFFLLNWKTCFCDTFKSTFLFFLFTTCGDRFTRTRRDVCCLDSRYSLFIFQYSERNWFQNFQMLANYCYFVDCAEFQSIYIGGSIYELSDVWVCPYSRDQHQYIAVLTVRGRPNPRTPAHTEFSLSLPLSIREKYS